MKKIILLLCLFVLFMPSTELLANTLEECREIDKNSERLECYDNIIIKQALLIKPKSEKAITVQNTSPTKTRLPLKKSTNKKNNLQDNATNEFGGQQFNPKANSLNLLRATLIGELKIIKKNTLLRLDNGQIWKVIGTNKSKKFNTALVRPEVVIEKGALSSHRLKINGHNGSYKVKRIK